MPAIENIRSTSADEAGTARYLPELGVVTTSILPEQKWVSVLFKTGLGKVALYLGGEVVLDGGAGTVDRVRWRKSLVLFLGGNAAGSGVSDSLGSRVVACVMRAWWISVANTYQYISNVHVKIRPKGFVYGSQTVAHQTVAHQRNEKVDSWSPCVNVI